MGLPLQKKLKKEKWFYTISDLIGKGRLQTIQLLEFFQL